MDEDHLAMRATLSADHRAIEGVVGARFLAAFRSHIETPLELGSAHTGVPCNA